MKKKPNHGAIKVLMRPYRGRVLLLCTAMLIIRTPLLNIYRAEISQATYELAGIYILIQSVVLFTMSYQMPVNTGIIRGGGDAKFTMYMNIISTWLIVMPLSFMSAFWWHWSVPAVVMVIQSDQIFKGMPTFLRFRGYKWIKKLTREEA